MTDPAIDTERESRSIDAERAPLSIDRERLRRSLVWAAQIRSFATMAATVPAAIWAALLAGVAGVAPEQRSGFGMIWFFAGPMLLSWAMTELVCRPMVRCPICAESLWSCGSGNFKPRRMQLKHGADRCPSCRTPIT